MPQMVMLIRLHALLLNSIVLSIFESSAIKSDLEKDIIKQIVFQNASKCWQRYVVRFVESYLQKLHIYKVIGEHSKIFLQNLKYLQQATKMFTRARDMSGGKLHVREFKIALWRWKRE